MAPDDILGPFLKRYQLPDSVVQLLYLLLQLEIEKGFPSLQHEPKYDRRDPAIRIATGLDHILSRLPSIQDQGGGRLSTSILSLIGYTESDTAFLHSLMTPVRRIEHDIRIANANREIERLQQVLDRRESGEDVSYERSALRAEKQHLKDLGPFEELVYTPKLFSTVLSFNVSFDLPLQHQYILGQTGHGKSTLLKQLIYQEKDDALVLLDSQGDLIHQLTKWKELLPVIIEPNQHPALNLFDIGDPELVGYVLSSILDTAATAKQTTLLNYSTRLITEAGGTILDLRALMKADSLPQRFASHVPNLSRSAQEFFGEFGNKKLYGETKEQLLWRIDLLLENPIIEEMFSHTHTKFSIADAMDTGRTVFINSDKARLGQTGSTFFARFFVALIVKATLKRALTKHRPPVHVFIDEAQDVIDKNISTLLEQSRKYNVAITLAHQQLAQLPSDIAASVITNTPTKFIGGPSADDARRLASDMRTVADVLLDTPKLTFIMYAKGLTKTCIPFKAKHFEVEYRSSEEVKRLMESNAFQVSSPRPQQARKAAEPEAKYTDDDGTGISIE